MAPISGLHEPERLAGAVAAAGFAKRPAAKASRATRAIAEPELPVAMRAIPIKLAPLVSQFKGQGRLSLRVEQMPVLSRLSAGRNNGDNTWSLGLDELEDLAFLLPEGLDERHVLAIRIVSFDGVEASTLAVLDFPLSADGDISAAMDVADDGQLRRLRDELTKTKAILAARDSELAETRKKIELAKAEWQAEQIAHLAASSTETQERIAEARERWLLEQEAAISKAKVEWNSGEAARLAAAETQWRKQLADVTARCERAEAALVQTKAPVHDDELELRLREELAEAQNNLAEREAALEQMKLAAAQTQERLRQEFKTALSRAQSDWKAGEAARFSAAEALTRADSKTGEAARLATAEANWRKQSENALAELVARCERAEAALAHVRAEANAPDPRDGELHDLRQTLTAAKAALADREIALAQSRMAAEETQARLQQEQQSALAKAKADWMASEAARLTAAEERWRRQSESALAEVTARCEKTEAALEQSLLAVEQMRERGQRELEAALSQAKANWKASEAPRAADTQLRQHLADATERYEAAEMALAQLRTKMEAARVHTDETAIGHLRDEIAALHATLAGREAELAELRSAGVSRIVPESRIVVHQDRGWVAPETEPAPKGSRRLIRDAVAAAILAASGIIFFPNIEALVSDNWPATGQSPAPAQAAVPATPHVAAQPMAVIARNGNVRSGPSKGAAILATLQQGVKVAILEQQGNWTHIRVDTKDGKSQQGWVFSTFLKSDDLRPAKN